jgi:glycosyltransferase involved in cell wall biosynthesis
MSAPRISVITAVLNGSDRLMDCLTGVARQRGIEMEHIVIDGGSTDGTVALLEQHAEHLAYWSSEPDGGIAQAMNKGILKARGTWLLFLHADDFLVDDPAILQTCVDIADSSGADVAAFPVLFGTPPKLRRLDPRRPDWRLNLKMGMCHQGVLTKREVFERLGPYDSGFRMDMDYEFLLRARRAERPMASFPEPVLAVMRDTGISSRTDWPSERKRFLEERKAHFMHAGVWPARVFYHAWWALYLPFRRLRARLGGRVQRP